MRDCTAAEEQLIRQDICPFCRAHGFLAGPTGGMSMNIFCPNEACGAGFNVNPVFTPEIIREPKFISSPIIEELSKFKPVGWYWGGRKRKHWWSIRKTSFGGWGIFK